ACYRSANSREWMSSVVAASTSPVVGPVSVARRPGVTAGAACAAAPELANRSDVMSAPLAGGVMLGGGAGAGSWTATPDGEVARRTWPYPGVSCQSSTTTVASAMPVGGLLPALSRPTPPDCPAV